MRNTILLKIKWLIVLLCIIPAGVFAQTIEVRGVVKDISGETIIGVNVVEKGTTNGITTDIDGNYSIQVSGQNAILVFTYIGYTPEEVAVGTQKTINIVLKDDFQKLDEVVVIGYGTAKKSDLTGAVTRANMGALEKSPNVDILQGLKGVVPGLNVGVATKAGDAPEITIRGRNTISGSTTPLIVLDGTIFRGNLVDINPSDIESMDVLKDASSTAIYGSQAANGVIMITSKSAKNMTKPIVEYGGSFSFQSLMNNDLKRLNRDEYIDILGDIFLSASRTGDDMLQKNPSFDPTTYLKDESAIKGYRDGTNTDWWDLLTEPTPYIQKHNISLRGKNETSGYFVSFGFLDQKNLVKNDNYKRYNIRMNLDSQVTSWLKIGTQAFFTLSDFSGTNTGFSSLFTTPALVSPYAEDGTTYEKLHYLGWTNPLLSIDNPDDDKRYNISGNVYADVTIPWVKGLSYRATYSNNWMIYKKYYFNPYANSLMGQGSKRHSLQNEWTFDNIVTYKREFGKHAVNATFVYGIEKRTYETTTAQGNNYTDFTLGYNKLNAGQSNLNVISSGAWEETSLYNMLRLGYTYNDRYIFTGTVRRDGFSGFGKNHKFGTFPSLAAAWRISEENFLKEKTDWIDNLKLRLSYGSSGNRTAGRYSTMAKMSAYRYGSTDAGGYVFGDGGSPELSQSVSSMPNVNLKWETTNSVNFGLDFGVLNGRLFGTYDFYVSNTKDLLYNINIPNVNGIASSIATNIGKLNNRGHEFGITGIPVRTKDFEWSVTFNFSTNKNKVKTILGIDADGDGIEDDLVSSGIFIGQPLSAIYDYNQIGMWQLGDYHNGSIPDGFTYGVYKIEDIDGDGNYTADKDRKIVGYGDPLYRFSIQNNLRYKDFELNVFINSIQGGSDHYLGQPAKYLPIPDHLTNNSYMKFDYWTPENPNAKYRQLGYYTPSLGSGYSPYVSRSFIRLQELSLAYNIPSDILKKVQINRARVYVSAYNLFTITKWDGWDPEANQGLGYELRINGDANNQGYPTMKSYTIGVNFEF